ncbi:MAG: hypothetical protein PHX30_01275 [Candidatus Pacebacteria bacterium]|jgi:hypothetical protein|nr:hypothetical protein [Candidatus Paceibacterota bacterium]
MKEIANTDKYVDDIIKELPPSPRTRRFREELLEHIADAEEDLQNQENNFNQIKTKVMQKIGDKDTLTKSYVDFYRSSLSSLWPIELLIYIALSLCVFLVTDLILSPYELITDSSLWILKIAVIIFSILVAYVFNRIVYTFAAKRLSPHLSSKKAHILVAWSLVIMPILSFIYGWAYILYWEVQKSGLEFFISEYFAITVLKIAIMHLAAAIAFGIIPRRKKKVSTLSNKVPYLLLFIFLTIMFFSVMLAQQKSDSLSASGQFINVLTSYLAMPINILYSFLDGLDVYAPSGGQIFTLNVFAALDSLAFFRMFLALLIITAVGGVWLIISADKSKSENGKNWKRATGIALIAYSAFVLLPINKVQQEDPILNVPAFNVTQKIEQDQRGLLYPALKYVDQSIRNNAFYAVYRDGNLFTIGQSFGAAGNYFLIDVNNVPEGQDPVISTNAKEKGMESYTLEFNPFEGMIPQGFECPDCITTRENDEAEDISYSSYDDSGTRTYYSADYTNLTYNGHRLLAEGKNVKPHEIKVSANQEWALIEFDSEQLYLIDLRRLK